MTPMLLVLPEAQAPQPEHDVHDGAPTVMVAGIMILAPKGVYWGTRQLVCREASESEYGHLAQR
jgi:hypothetical protein